MALDPTAQEKNLLASLRKYISDQAGAAGISVSFDDETPDMSSGTWINVVFNEPEVGQRGRIIANHHTAANGSNRRYLITELRDTVVGWYSRVSIPMYEFTVAPAAPTEIGSFFVEDIFPGQRLEGGGGMLYRVIAVHLGFFARM